MRFILIFIAVWILNSYPAFAAEQASTLAVIEKKGEPVTLKTNAEILSNASQLSLEHQHYLVYLYARLGNVSMARGVAHIILDKDPSDQQALLELASMYAEKKSADGLQGILQALQHYYPDDPKTRYYQAVYYQLTGRHAEARALLLKIKDVASFGDRDGHAEDLAVSAQNAGDWPLAIATYKKILDDNPMGSEIYHSVRQALDGLYKKHLPQMTLTSNWLELNTGSELRNRAEYEMPLTARNRMFVEFGRDEISLLEDENIKGGAFSRQEGRVRVENWHSEEWQTAYYAGGFDDGWLGGGKLQRSFDDEQHIALALDMNQRDTEGLLLEALDARHDQLSLPVNFNLFHHFKCTFEPYGRLVRIQNEEIGQSVGFLASVERVVWRQNPEVVVGYRGSMMHYDPESTDTRLMNPVFRVSGDDPNAKQEQLNGLMLENSSWHGLYINVSGKPVPWVLCRGNLGVDFVEELDAFAYDFKVGVTFFPRKSIELLVDVGYQSAGSGQNEGSSVEQLDIALHWIF